LTGLTLPGSNVIYLNSAELLDEIFVRQNAWFSKWHDFRNVFSIISPTNIVFMETFHKDFSEKRKALSTAFFKSKLTKITTVIKDEVLEFIKTMCTSKEIDIVKFLSEL
jgi:cytochrome P450